METLIGDIESLSEELLAHPVNANEFFQTFKTHYLTPSQLRVFIKQYHYFCFQFVKILEGLLYHIPIEQLEMRAELAKTLYSELGNGSPERIHIRQLERFAYSIGLRLSDLQETIPLPEIVIYLQTLRRLFFHSGYLMALGAELAVETTAASEFQYFVDGLKKHKQFSQDDLEFFELHVLEEREHSAWIMDAVRKTVKSQKDFMQVRIGARETANAWLAFWKGMYRAVFDAKSSDTIF